MGRAGERGKKMKSTLKQILDRQGILVLDGSMGTALENLGADLNNKLWTARVLAALSGQCWHIRGLFGRWVRI